MKVAMSRAARKALCGPSSFHSDRFEQARPEYSQTRQTRWIHRIKYCVAHRALMLSLDEANRKRAPDASPGSVMTLLGTPPASSSPRKIAARDLSQRGNARRRGAASTASVGEPDAHVGVAEAGVSGPLRANSVRAPRFSVRAGAARQHWQVIIIRHLRRRPVP